MNVFAEIYYKTFLIKSNLNNNIFRSCMVFHYSENERLLMFLLNSVSNLSAIFTMKLIWNKQNFLMFYLTLLCIISSISYHGLESLNIGQFGMTATQWHQCDNVGASICFIMYLIEFMSLKDQMLKHLLLYQALFLTYIINLFKSHLLVTCTLGNSVHHLHSCFLSNSFFSYWLQ